MQFASVLGGSQKSVSHSESWLHVPPIFTFGGSPEYVVLAGTSTAHVAQHAAWATAERAQPPTWATASHDVRRETSPSKAEARGAQGGAGRAYQLPGCIPDLDGRRGSGPGPGGPAGPSPVKEHVASGDRNRREGVEGTL